MSVWKVSLELRLAEVLLIVFGVSVIVGACGHCLSQGEAQSEDLERRAIYLDCLHEYSLGGVVGVDEGDDEAAVRRCAALAGLELQDVQP